jgi:NADH:ubiquinone oxidoreductase subunit C
MDLFANDYLKYQPEKPERFAVVYNLYAMNTQERLLVKSWVPEGECEIESIHDLYAAANWFEREAWDLYGVVFKNHPNLQRILCHTEFEGHPLRKDYPADKYQRLKVAAPSTGF